MALRFCVVLSLVVAIAARHCSTLCGTCCPSASLVIDSNGDCWRGSQLVCRVASASCTSGTAAEQCPPVSLADISITQPLDAHTPVRVQTDNGPSSRRPVEAVDSFISPGLPVWEQLSLSALPGESAVLHDVPDYLLGFQVKTSVQVRLRAASTVAYLCPNDAFDGEAATPCHVVVLLYECHPCESAKGGLPQYLVADGYARTRCAPRFTNGRTRTRHPLSAYVKTIQPGTLEEIVLPEDAEFVIFALSHGGAIDCAALDFEQCGNTRGFCRWAGACRIATCVSQGPSRGGCDTDRCLLGELGPL
eukprot:TRINITY_DN26_c0_g2_i1.p1 TRINITY_DN26_c0_g2~~TRINITY_DN26_c0_g2_i1.p1  ORF type:complete len:305 (+),score=67.20 TRINITY_DN26_c0_g2_i1:58-972(+)